MMFNSSITQKDQRTYRRVLEGADVGVLWRRKPEDPGKTNDLGRATITRPHAYTNVKLRALGRYNS